MSTFTLTNCVCVPALLLLLGSTAQGATLWVNCGSKTGLTSISAALKALQNSEESHRSNTIKVSGACKENIVIQSMDRLTLTAANGASVSDTSGGKLDVINIEDSWDVAINGFTINAGSDGVSGANGIECGDFSTCRLSGNVIQGATSGAGFLVQGRSQATLDGDTLQNNGVGLQVRSSSGARLGLVGRPFTSRGNGRGIDLRRGAYAFIAAVVENNSDVGIAVMWHSTLDLTSGSISGSGSVGALVSEASFARFLDSTISGNAGGGVAYSDLSMGDFVATTVRGNGGGTDVVCNPQFAATRGTGSIGGTTNCVEP
jgi:Right handed beta helix region